MPQTPSGTPFDFGKSVTMPFQTSGGPAFAKRLWFWTAIPMVLALLLAVPIIAPHYPALMAWQTQYVEAIMSGQKPDDELILSVGGLISNAAPGYLVMILGLWISAVMGEAALHRKVLRDVELPGRPVRFGADEIRVMLTQLCVWGLIFGVYLVGMIGALALGGLLTAALGAIGGAIGVIALLAVLYFMCKIAVRLMPAAAMGVGSGNLVVREAADITKGRFWPLFGSFVLVYIAGTIVTSVVSSVGLGIAFGDALQSGESGIASGVLDTAAITEAAAQRIKNPVVIFSGIICIIAYGALMSLWFLCLSGIGSYAALWGGAERFSRTFE